MSAESTIPAWFQLTQPVALVMIGLFGAWIAFQQWHTAKEKLRLDLFDRRMRVFIALREYLSAITAGGAPEHSDIVKYGLEAIEQGHFLFGDDVGGR